MASELVVAITRAPAALANCGDFGQGKEWMEGYIEKQLADGSAEQRPCFPTAAVYHAASFLWHTVVWDRR